jgi:exonuclease VII small subunit
MFIAGACSSYEYLETISKRLEMSIGEYSSGVALIG